MKKILVYLLLFFIAFLLLNCKRNGDSDIPDDVSIAIQNVTSAQEDYFETFSGLLLEFDTASAKDSIVSLLLSDPDVEWAVPNITGVNIQYKSGIKGGLFLGSRGEDDGEDILADIVYERNIPSAGRLKNTLNGVYNIPPTKRTVIICPAYDEFELAVDTLAEIHDGQFDRTDFWRPEYEFGSHASVEKFAFLQNYGVIILYSHGTPWPSDKNIKEVYLQTGEVVNSATNSRYWKYINEGEIPILHGYRGNVYFVGPEFIKKYNYLENDSTLIYGGFCFSNLGSWPETILEAGAAGYFGFDWSVKTNKCDKYQYLLFEMLTDTTLARPYTCQTFMSLLGKYSSYYDKEYERNVSLLYSGDPNLALWKPKTTDVIDFTYTHCNFSIYSRANYTNTKTGDYNFAFNRSAEVEGSYKEGVFTGYYEYIDGDYEKYDTVIIELDLVNHLITDFSVFGSVKEPSSVDFMITNYLITSSDTPLPLNEINRYVVINGTEVENYLLQVSFETTWKDEADGTLVTNRLNHLNYDEDSELEVEFW